MKQVLREPTRVLTGVDDLVDHAEDRAAVTGRQRIDCLVQQAVRGVAQQCCRDVVGHPVRAGAAHQLVKHGKAVTHRSRAGADHKRHHGRLDGHALADTEVDQVVAEDLRGDQPERVVVRARADRADDLVWLRGREDEPQM